MTDAAARPWLLTQAEQILLTEAHGDATILVLEDPHLAISWDGQRVVAHRVWHLRWRLVPGGPLSS